MCIDEDRRLRDAFNSVYGVIQQDPPPPKVAAQCYSVSVVLPRWLREKIEALEYGGRIPVRTRNLRNERTGHMARTIGQDAEDMAASFSKRIDTFHEKHGIMPNIRITKNLVVVTAAVNISTGYDPSRPGTEDPIETKGDADRE